MTGGQCSIPSQARAIAVNLTVTGSRAPGDIRVFPDTAELPLVSTANYGAGQTRANNAVIALGSNIGFTVHVDQDSGTVDLIADVVGYFR